MNLLERENVLQELDLALQEVTASHGRVVLISGEAGIGKTAVVEQFIHHKTRPQRVLWGTCDALFTPRPLGPLHDMARQSQDDLLAALQGEWDRPAVFTACLNACQTPTILVFEDIHWADEATLDLLKYLGRRMQHTRSLLLATYRDDELGPQHPLRLLLGDLVRTATTHRLTLSPLSVEAVRQLADRQDIDSEALHQQTGGNPFFVTEVLAAGQNGIPTTIRDAVLARAARLSLSGRAVLNAAAVIGQRIEPWLLIEVTRAEAGAVDESLALGVLLPQAGLFVFRHELARQTILKEIPPHQRTFLHQAILDALKDSPTAVKDLARLAHHAAAAGDQKAILTYARAAGQEAAALGMNRAAAAQFALALRYVDALPAMEQIELYEAYGLSMQAEPEKKTTIAAYRRAAELAHEAELPLREGFNLARLSGAFEMIDELEAAENTLREALALLEPRAPNRGLVEVYRELAYRHLKLGNSETAVSYAEKCHEIAQWTEKIHVIIGSYQMLGLCWLPLNHQKGCEYLEKGRLMALEHDDFWTAGALYPNMTMTYTDVYNLSRAEELAAAGIAFAEEHDMDISRQVLAGWQGMVYLYQGRWPEAAATAASLLGQSPIHPYALTPARLITGRLRTRQGAADGDKFLDEALAGLLKTGNRQRLATAYMARAEAAWLAGDPERTLAEARAVYDLTIRNKQPGFAAELAYWRWRAGDEVETFDWMVRPFVLEIHGHWRSAAAVWEALGCPYEQARALADGDSEAQLTALSLFEQLGARPMADIVRQKLREAGVPAIPRGPRAATKENPFQLTNRQLEILLLLTENLTNAEIAARLHISPKTVDHHVSAVLAGLNVSSREEAAALARQHPDL